MLIDDNGVCAVVVCLPQTGGVRQHVRHLLCPHTVRSSAAAPPSHWSPQFLRKHKVLFAPRCEEEGGEWREGLE